MDQPIELGEGSVMDLQMRRHKWFPDRFGIDVCGACAQPDFPEVGVFCPGPKPATPEPPVWKVEVDGTDYFCPPFVPPYSALEAFIARRVKKREVNPAPTSAEIIAEKRARWAAEDQARDFARAMSTPLTFTARLGMKHP